MSTRGFVAIGKPGGAWDGRYNHSDSYPTWLGREVFEEARRWLHNDGHLHGFAQKLLAAHRWEQFTGEDCDGNKSDHITPENADWLFMWQTERYTSAVVTTVSLDGQSPVWEAVERRGHKLCERLGTRYMRNPEHPDLAGLRELPTVEVWN